MDHSSEVERLALFSAAHYGVFTLEHARGCGLSENQVFARIETNQWRLVHRNVYRWVSTPRTWKGDVLAACWAGGFRALASHRSAAALWGLPGSRSDLVEITCPRWRRARHDRLVVHETNVIDSRGPDPV